VVPRIVTFKYFNIWKVATYGTPGPVTSIGYDPVQSLLAIGKLHFVNGGQHTRMLIMVHRVGNALGFF
jgi:hypothetical protein